MLTVFVYARVGGEKNAQTKHEGSLVSVIPGGLKSSTRDRFDLSVCRHPLLRFDQICTDCGMATLLLQRLLRINVKTFTMNMQGLWIRERLDVISLPLRGMWFIVQYGERNAASACRCPLRSTGKPPPHGSAWILLKYGNLNHNDATVEIKYPRDGIERDCVQSP